MDQKLKWATDVLHDHGADWHPKDSSCDKSKFLTVKERMADAKAKDGSTSSILDTLKEKFLNQVRFKHTTLACAHTNLSRPQVAG